MRKLYCAIAATVLAVSCTHTRVQPPEEKPELARAMSVKHLVSAPIVPSTLEYNPPPILDTSSQIDDPWVPRVLGISKYGSNFVVVNKGNELQFIRLSDLRQGASSMFRVPPFGDRDYNLLGYSLCEDCTHGVACFQSMGTIIFSLNTSIPSFGSFTYKNSVNTSGAIAFRHNGAQYLIVNSWNNLCNQGAELYLANGPDADDLMFVQCLVNGSGASESIKGGIYYPGEPGYVWVINGTHVYQYEVSTQGGMHMEYMMELTRAGWSCSPTLAVDVEHKLLAVAGSIYNELWDLSTLPIPTNLASFRAHPTLEMDMAAIKYPYLWLSCYGGTNELFTHTYNITDPTNPVEIWQETWANTAPAQQYGHAGNMGGVFVDNNFYEARWSVLQKFTIHEEPVPTENVFANGFETNSTTNWSSTVQ